MQRVLIEGLTTSDRGTSIVDEEVRGSEDRVMGAAMMKEDKESQSANSITDQPIDPLLPSAPSLFASPTSSRPSVATSEPTISAPPSTTAKVHRNRSKRGLKSGKRAKLAEADGDEEEEEMEVFVETDATIRSDSVAIVNTDNIPKSGFSETGRGEEPSVTSIANDIADSGKPTAETHRESVSRTMLDIITEGTSTKAETSHQSVSTNLPNQKPNITTTSLAMTTKNASLESTIYLNAVTTMPSYATDDTLAAIASETLLKVDMQRQQIPSRKYQDFSAITRVSFIGVVCFEFREQQPHPRIHYR